HVRTLRPLLLTRPTPHSTLFPYTTLFRSDTGRPVGLARGCGWTIAGGDRRRPRGQLASPHSSVTTHPGLRGRSPGERGDHVPGQDRKSTRLNSSHVAISYAVFCLIKKAPA